MGRTSWVQRTGTVHRLVLRLGSYALLRAGSIGTWEAHKEESCPERSRLRLLTCMFVVVGTGVDPVTSRFSVGPSGFNGCRPVPSDPQNRRSAHYEGRSGTGRHEPAAGRPRDPRGMHAVGAERRARRPGADLPGLGLFIRVGGDKPRRVVA